MKILPLKEKNVHMKHTRVSIRWGRGGGGWSLRSESFNIQEINEMEKGCKEGGANFSNVPI